MQLETLLLVFRVLAVVVFCATLYAGYYMGKNFQKLFGVDSSMPSENGSSRAYSRVQVWAVWTHILFASAAFALFLH